MLVAMRKHTKLIFWIIIVLLVPAFAVFYVPRAFQRRGPRVIYGDLFGKAITVSAFREARDAEYRALTYFIAALRTLDYRKPQYGFLRARRDVYLAQIAILETRYGETLSLEDARDYVKQLFTDPRTGEYDAAAYRKRLRALGMTDEAYVAEMRDNVKVQRYYVYPVLYGEGDQGWQAQRRAAWLRLALAHEADRLRIPVSDAEVLNYLALICPGENGTIDEEIYANRLRSAGKDRTSFERELRTTIRIAKLQRMILDSVKAPAQQVTDRFDERYQTFNMGYHLERYEPLMQPEELHDDDVLAYYVRNRGRNEAFAIEHQVAVLYVLVETQAFEPKVEVEDDELKAYHKAHPAAFTDADGVPLPYEMCSKQVRAAVVKQKAEALARAEVSRLFLVPTPARLIQEAARRGYEVRYTPLFGEKGPIDGVIADDEQEFRDTAFAVPAGRVNTQAVKVAQGWCVLSPTREVPAPKGISHRPFAEVADVARTELARSNARSLAHSVAANLFGRVEDMMGTEQIGFLDACGRLELNVTETGFLSRDDKEVPGLEEGRGLIYRGAFPDEEVEHELAAADRPLEVFYVLDVEQGAVFFRVLERRDPDASVRAEKEPEFAADVVLRSLRGAAYEEWRSALLTKAAIRDVMEERRQAEQQRQRQQTPGGGLQRQ